MLQSPARACAAFRSALDPQRVDVLSAVDSSCLMQIRGRLQRQGSRVGAMHLAEILASR